MYSAERLRREAFPLCSKSLQDLISSLNMKQHCKHCGTPYSPAKGQGDFCCAGCERVYELIQAGGLGDYYARQDQIGRPVGDDPLMEPDTEFLEQLLDRRERKEGISYATLGLQGMSCMGCVWLIEQLARRSEGVVSAKVALNSSRLSLAWRDGVFDLSRFALDLQAFGYRLTAAQSMGLSLSPLVVRFWLTAVFSINGLLLVYVSTVGIARESLSGFYELLLSACMVFSLLIGGSLFILPSWRALQLGRLHSDSVPAITLLLLFALVLVQVFFSRDWAIGALSFCLLLPTMVFSRWLSETWVLRKAVE